MSAVINGIFDVETACPDTMARAGTLKLYHGDVKTPVFMPVGTNGTVKTFMPYELTDMNVEIILSNSYHLYLRPGMDVMEKLGGLHEFMGWNGNILTDSGGFQIFSLSSLTKIKKDGMEFNSHIDGSRHYLTPEDVIRIQMTIGSDIMMVLDHCTKPDTRHDAAAIACDTTTRWAMDSYNFFTGNVDRNRQKLFGIVQGNFYKDLRKRSAEEISSIDFDGYAIGGLSVGEERSVFADFLSYTSPLLPAHKPRYLMGVGTPEDLFCGVENGIDMFDCVFPTRIARNASGLTAYGRINLRNEKYKYDKLPLDPECDCHVCADFSKSYIRHLFKANEITASRMTSYHNIYFIKKLMNNIRKSVIEGNFKDFKREFLGRYNYENNNK